jgi:very-short-patch-repair endonuclease
MMVFTSFDPSMIDLNRTSARAVHDLRHFIEFADQGPKAITNAIQGSVGGYDSPFEQFVADGLRVKGWQTHPQIGVSRFRIDLGVVHPDHPGDYLVGVECDGATYHSAATARDRDKIRSEILRGLGWRLIRVWSTEWWVDREGALERLHHAISEVLEKSRASVAELERAQKETSAAAANAAAAEGAAIAERDADSSADAGNEDIFDAASGKPQDSNLEPLRLVARGPDNAYLGTPIRHTYRKADLSDLEASLKPESFHDASYDATLDTLIRRVLEQEAPILDKVLVDRIARAHGFKRSGRLIRERVLELVERSYHLRPDPEPEHGHFVWMSADDPERWNTYRIPEGDGDVRFVEEIPREEIIAAAQTIKNGELPIEIARTFGIRKLSAAAKGRIDKLLREYRG